jgi:hypothetical protein
MLGDRRAAVTGHMREPVLMVAGEVAMRDRSGQVVA